MRTSCSVAAAALACVILSCATASSADPIVAGARLGSPNTSRTIGFVPWFPAGFHPDSAVILTGAQLPAGAKRFPELIVEGAFKSMKVEIHEYRQSHVVGQSDLFVDDSRVARLISVWPADHAMVDRSGRVIGFLVTRGLVHFDFYMENGVSLRELRSFIANVVPRP
jgi:hypothetical protein